MYTYERVILCHMADACGLDIDEIVQEKIKVNNEKYPVSKAKGKKEKYNKL